MIVLGISFIVIAVVAFLAIWIMSKNNNEANWMNKSKKVIITFVIIFAILGVGFTYLGLNSQTFQRDLKNIQSNYTGGINRKITVVNQEGQVIKEYSGKMDIEENTGEKLTFILDGKKHIIYNSVLNTIYVEEY